MGLQNGVEKITKMMMVCLLFLMVVLAINSVRMEGGRPGLEFYLKPDFGKIQEVGVGKVVCGAGTVVLHVEYRYRCDGDFWKLY